MSSHLLEARFIFLFLYAIVGPPLLLAAAPVTLLHRQLDGVSIPTFGRFCL